MSDFILTIESDEEGQPVQNSQSSSVRRRKTLRKETLEEPTIVVNPSFSFDGLAAEYATDIQAGFRRPPEIDDPLGRFWKKNAASRVSLDNIIARHKSATSQFTEVDTSFENSSESSGPSSEREGDISGQDSDCDSRRDSEGHGAGIDSSLCPSSQERDSDEASEGYDSTDDGEVNQGAGQKPIPESEAISADANAYFDTASVPFEPATQEELAQDSQDQPFASLPGTSSLSRPVLLGLSSMSISTPTPIQRQTIPLALLGKDLVCSSVTGSGKTLGYMVPTIERLTWRDKRGGGKTRVLVLTPTRELALQVFQVGKLVARYTDIAFSLCVGGMKLRIQEAELRQRPEVVVGTPGRVIDHVRNTQGFSLDTLEILVIDEADRILEEGFHDELEEIIRHCPRSRQTMLFSATVTESVADLARLSLDKPVRIKIDPPKSTAVGLTQEFLRVRDSPGSKKGSASTDLLREATLISLCKVSSFGKGRTIIFFKSKAGAHRMKIIFSLFSLKAEELHGNLSQEQRLISLQRFKDGEVLFLLATDLASRGLDIKGVQRVMNYECPSQYEVYLHRIGRTARAGEKGSALTLYGESDRHLVKEARKNCASMQGAIKQRKVDSSVVAAIKKELETMTSTIDEILLEEREEKELKTSEMEVKKGLNLIEHDEEIKSRPARTWFQSQAEKKKANESGKTANSVKLSNKLSTFDTKNNPKRDRFDGLSRKQKRRKMALEEEAKERSTSGIGSAIRAAKKAQRPSKIGADVTGRDLTPGNNRKKNKQKGKKSKSSFSVDLGAKKRALRGSQVGALRNSKAKKRV